MQAVFCALKGQGLIAFSGEDAATFLHAQLTSDIMGLAADRTQYGGYCSPKGRLLATFLLWRRPGDILLQLPADLRESVQERLAKYVLRSRVRVMDASEQLSVFGIAGAGAASIVSALGAADLAAAHQSVGVEAARITRLPGMRYVAITEADRASSLREHLARHAHPQPESLWTHLDIEAGVPNITTTTQEQYVPQMVNLDLLGGVSYSKGCYPGQEIVARMHYLGRLKQRMYRVRVITNDRVLPGDPLFSPEFGAEQASGSIVQAVGCGDGAHEALAVVQIGSARSDALRFKSLNGPGLEFLTLPYAIAP
jgi:folate-binding protein YgfZ